MVLEAAGSNPVSHPFEASFVLQRMRLFYLTHLRSFRRVPVHRKDPFDRMIVSQAIVEQIPAVTADSAFGSYAVATLW